MNPDEKITQISSLGNQCVKYIAKIKYLLDAKYSNMTNCFWYLKSEGNEEQADTFIESLKKLKKELEMTYETYKE